MLLHNTIPKGYYQLCNPAIFLLTNFYVAYAVRKMVQNHVNDPKAFLMFTMFQAQQENESKKCCSNIIN